MVSLRERTARASYSNVAEGLADLSSEDETDNENAGPSAAASASGSGSGDTGDEGEKDDDTSFSSGESSEFKPDSPEKGQGKGKGKERAQDDNDNDEDRIDDDDEMMDDIIEDEEDDEDDIDPALREMSVTSGIEPLPTFRNSRPADNASRSRPAQQTRNVSTAAYPAHGQSEISLLSLQHRALIQASSVAMTKPPTVPRNLERENEKHLAREKDQSRTHGVGMFPAGTPVPFTTSLISNPHNGWAGNHIEWKDESGDSSERNTKRRDEAWANNKHMTFAVPWEEWKGESWYPETYLGVEEENMGKRENWLMRDEVRLGLDDIGRWTKEELHFLNELEAEEAYLPTPLYKESEPFITCHMGPRDQQSAHTFSIFDSKPLSETNGILPRKGHTFFAGGPIWGMDWCPYPDSKSADFGYEQYLAISTLPHLETRPHMSEKWPRSSKGAIQVWAISPPPSGEVPVDEPMDGDARTGNMTCLMVLCLSGGPAMEIKWMPLGVWDNYDSGLISHPGSKIPKLGVLAAIQLDGSVSFYAVPHPRFLNHNETHPLYIKMDVPLLRLEIPDAMAMCFDWITGSRIAVGFSNGHLAVWDVYDALRNGTTGDVLPSLYTPVSRSAVRSISVGRVPPTDKQLGGEPAYLLMGSYDGTTSILDLRDPLYPVVINRARVPCMAVKWLTQMASPALCDIDYAIQVVKMRGNFAGRSHALSSHRGQVWDLATSDYHTMLVSAGSDGALILTNFYTGFYRKRKAPLGFHRLYEMDYSESRDEYRIVDDFLPESQTLENAISRRPPNIARRATHDTPSQLLKTAAWKPEVGLHKVAWNEGCGLSKAGWLASGGASGLGRVEWIEGRWKNGESRRIL
ncbi:uncharacterized protein IL334_007350 [Kwoniella shivajii]|uniref:Transcription factor TFIIIC complex subunit Tfc6 n=1 Tax=Kwoniella shivajii TaxID=564305 RepID=A0ABZ1D9T4_9TREE|nr:hypothetical protein IL334_007350 [Kwoniella shivajii]